MKEPHVKIKFKARVQLESWIELLQSPRTLPSDPPEYCDDTNFESHGQRINDVAGDGADDCAGGERPAISAAEGATGSVRNDDMKNRLVVLSSIMKLHFRPHCIMDDAIQLSSLHYSFCRWRYQWCHSRKGILHHRAVRPCSRSGQCLARSGHSSSTIDGTTDSASKHKYEVLPETSQTTE